MNAYATAIGGKPIAKAGNHWLCHFNVMIDTFVSAGCKIVDTNIQHNKNFNFNWSRLLMKALLSSNQRYQNLIDSTKDIRRKFQFNSLLNYSAEFRPKLTLKQAKKNNQINAYRRCGSSCSGGGADKKTSREIKRRKGSGKRATRKRGAYGCQWDGDTTLSPGLRSLRLWYQRHERNETQRWMSARPSRHHFWQLRRIYQSFQFPPVQVHVRFRHLVQNPMAMLSM